jgi:MFS superfamily sulfate permease-like transporter
VVVFDLAGRGVQVIGVLPRGLPTLAFPGVGVEDLPLLFSGALGIALVTVADTTVLSQSLAARQGEPVDSNQELVALGAANLAAGVFQGFPISASASRTPVAIAAGARSQLTPLVGAASIALLLVAAPGLLRNLPQPILAAVVITAAIGLVDERAVRRLYRVRRAEFVLWLAAFVGVALLGVLRGIFIERYPEARQVPGLLLYRFDAPLFFANAGFFRRRIRGLVAAARPRVRWVVVAAEPITDVDTTAADVLGELLAELRRQGVTFAFTEMKDPVKDRLRRYGLFDVVGADRFFPTVGTAVDAYVKATGVEWVDWEEQPERPA